MCSLVTPFQNLFTPLSKALTIQESFPNYYPDALATETFHQAGKGSFNGHLEGLIPFWGLRKGLGV